MPYHFHYVSSAFDFNRKSSWSSWISVLFVCLMYCRVISVRTPLSAWVFVSACVYMTIMLWALVPFTSMPVMFCRWNMLLRCSMIRGSRKVLPWMCAGVLSHFFWSFWESKLAIFASGGLLNISWLCYVSFDTEMLWIKHDRLHNQKLLMQVEGQASLGSPFN